VPAAALQEMLGATELLVLCKTVRTLSHGFIGAGLPGKRETSRGRMAPFYASGRCTFDLAQQPRQPYDGVSGFLYGTAASPEDERTNAAD